MLLVRFDVVSELLHIVEFAVLTVKGYELVVSALFDDSAFADNTYSVGEAYCRQAVRHHNGCTPFHKVLDGLLHEMFRFGIESRSGLVENEYRRVFQYGTGYGEALALPAGKERAAVAYTGLIAIGGGDDEVVCIGNARPFPPRRGWRGRLRRLCCCIWCR